MPLVLLLTASITVFSGSRVFFLHLEGVIITVTVLEPLWDSLVVSRGLNPCSSLTVGPKEGPVAGGDGLVVLANSHGNRAGEDVQGELLDPLVPVTLVELGAV